MLSRNDFFGLCQAVSLMCFSSIFTYGCTTNPTGPNLVPIRGKVICDGVAAEGVRLTLHSDSQAGAISTGTSGPDGTFEISTFEQGDGAMPGSYVVTCEWGSFDPLTRSYDGDRLGGKFSSKEDSSIRWTISATEPPEFKTVELTAKLK